jgi:hypothetical protein
MTIAHALAVLPPLFLSSSALEHGAGRFYRMLSGEPEVMQ